MRLAGCKVHLNHNLTYQPHQPTPPTRFLCGGSLPVMNVLSTVSSILQTLLLSPFLFVFHIISAVFLPVTVIIRNVSHLVSVLLFYPFTLLSRFQVCHRGCYYCLLYNCSHVTGHLYILWDCSNHRYMNLSYFGCKADESSPGVLTGTLLGITIHFFIGVFGLQEKLETETSYTSATTSPTPSRKRALASVSTKSTHGQQPHPPVSRMLFPSSIPTILEEEDEDSLPGSQVGRQRSKKGSLDVLDVSDYSSEL